MATDETRAEAANPGTSPARLQELTNDSELWPLIARNPNAYDALLTWLGENGGADVQAALASRGGAAEPTSVLPSAPYEQAGPPLTPPPGGSALPPPGGATPPPAGFPPPGGHQGGPAGPNGSGGSKKGLWITLAVLVFVLVASGIGVGVWALTKGDDDSDRDTSSDSDPTDDPSDEPSDDTDDDSDSDSDSGDLDCDGLADLEDAAGDLTLYYPGLDEESDLEDAVATIEEFADSDERVISDAVEVLLGYADEVASDEDAVFGDGWSDAIDAEYEIVDFNIENC